MQNAEHNQGKNLSIVAISALMESYQNDYAVSNLGF